MTLVKLNHAPKTINNIFDDLFTELPGFFGKELNRVSGTPATNIVETKDAHHLEMNVPGRTKEDFIINIENGLLTISYEKKNEAANEDYKAIRREFSFASFKRSFTLDDSINAEQIQAKYENGLLKLLLPKKEEVKVSPKQISVQ